MSPDLQSVLLNLLAARNGIDPEALADAGGTAGAVDPRMSMLMNLLSQRQEAREEEEEIDDDTGDVGAMTAELEALRRRSDAAAAALGACYLCWGDDPGCVHCAGAGLPGWNDPDEALFRQLVVPAIRTRRLLHPSPHPRPRPASAAPGGESINPETKGSEP